MAGFQPISFLTGAPWNGQARQYPIDLTPAGAYPLNAGDPVCAVATGNISPATIAPLANPLLVTGQLIGVFVGCQYKLVGQLEVINSSYFPGPGLAYDMSVPPVANVVDDPNVMFSLQTNSTSGTGLVLTNVNNNSTFVWPAAASTTGQSGVLLDTNVFNTTSTTLLRVLGLAPNSISFTTAGGPNYTDQNSYGVVGNNALVIFNVHAYKGVGTPGV